ncbi:MAG: dipeptidase [Christensenellales bacterium]|jgi:membrane dipeptidase
MKKSCEVSRIVRIADSHSDFAALKVLSDAESRLFDHADLIRMVKGGIALQVFAIWVPPEHQNKKKCCLSQLNYLYDFIKSSNGHISLCTTATDFISPHTIKAVIAIESGESIDCSIDLLQQTYDFGARIYSLSWNTENDFANGCDCCGGLKPKGIKAIKKLNRLRAALDLSHINEQGFWEAVSIYEHAPCATHSSVYDIVPCQRNLKKDQIQYIIDKGGYIGVNFYTEFLRGSAASIDDILDHIEYILMCSGQNAVGFGSDFCGIQHTPKGLDSVAEYQKIPKAMSNRGFNDTLIQKICYGNFENYILKFYKIEQDELS